jgi:hypothetical protein
MSAMRSSFDVLKNWKSGNESQLRKLKSFLICGIKPSASRPNSNLKETFMTLIKRLCLLAMMCCALAFAMSAR